MAKISDIISAEEKQRLADASKETSAFGESAVEQADHIQDYGNAMATLLTLTGTYTDKNEAGAEIEKSYIGEGENSSETFSQLAVGMAGIEGKNPEELYVLDDFDQERMSEFGEKLIEAGEYLGADGQNVDNAFNDDDSAELMVQKIRQELEGDKFGESSHEEIIHKFKVDKAQQLMGEKAFNKKKAIRGGKAVIVKKKVGKTHLSSAQKRGLKKAQTKSQTGQAKIKRQKSLNIGRKKGLYK